jgi:Family of unknown function (DUF6092)
LKERDAMSRNCDPPAMTGDQAMRLIAFLVSSAEITLGEPVHYGTLRLVDAASRLIGFMEENGAIGSNDFLRELKVEIDTKKLWSMWDKPGYYQFLRETPGKVAAEMVRRGADSTDYRR